MANRDVKLKIRVDVQWPKGHPVRCGLHRGIRCFITCPGCDLCASGPEMKWPSFNYSPDKPISVEFDFTEDEKTRMTITHAPTAAPGAKMDAATTGTADHAAKGKETDAPTESANSAPIPKLREDSDDDIRDAVNEGLES